MILLGFFLYVVVWIAIVTIVALFTTPKRKGH